MYCNYVFNMLHYYCNKYILMLCDCKHIKQMHIIMVKQFDNNVDLVNNIMHHIINNDMIKNSKIYFDCEKQCNYKISNDDFYNNLYDDIFNIVNDDFEYDCVKLIHNDVLKNNYINMLMIFYHNDNIVNMCIMDYDGDFSCDKTSYNMVMELMLKYNNILGV